MNGKTIPHFQTAKYPGMTLDAKLRWKLRVKKKKRRAWFKIQTRVLAYGNTAMSTHSKLVLYKQILKPVWTYGIQLWGCTKPSNFATIQRFRNKVLKHSWYVRNAVLHTDLHMEMVTAEIRRFASKHEGRLLRYEVEAIQLLDNSELLRRLKRTKPVELVP
jgi:hypothetical protein